MRYTNPRGTENKENRQNNTSHNAPEVDAFVFQIIGYSIFIKG